MAKTKITKKQVLKKLEKLRLAQDTESAHADADALLLPRRVSRTGMGGWEVSRYRCNALVYKKDVPRRTGRGKSGYEMHFSKEQCTRLEKGETGRCFQHQSNALEALKLARAKGGYARPVGKTFFGKSCAFYYEKEQLMLWLDGDSDKLLYRCNRILIAFLLNPDGSEVQWEVVKEL